MAVRAQACANSICAKMWLVSRDRGYDVERSQKPRWVCVAGLTTALARTRRVTCVCVCVCVCVSSLLLSRLPAMCSRECRLVPRPTGRSAGLRFVSRGPADIFGRMPALLLLRRAPSIARCMFASRSFSAAVTNVACCTLASRSFSATAGVEPPPPYTTLNEVERSLKDTVGSSPKVVAYFTARCACC